MNQSVMVQYQVRPEFVTTNQTNITQVMHALKAKNSSTVQYAAFYLGDGVFRHMAHSSTGSFDDFAQLPEFKAFQQALKDSNPIQSPDVKTIEWQASNF
ncbi:MAG: hypothetical protein ACRCV6_08580 [Formosimonas sp.]